MIFQKVRSFEASRDWVRSQPTLLNKAKIRPLMAV